MDALSRACRAQAWGRAGERQRARWGASRQLERGDDSQRFVGFGNWEGIRQGLLAGERLALDLRRLDAAYISQNRREYELTKTVSLLHHDPVQLLNLRELGVAELSLSEADFDRDHPTHYLRRLRTVSVSIPCVTGPTQGVAGRLTLLRGETRATANAIDTTVSRGVLQSIVTSSGQNDAGLFEINLKDERLLPFEGAGAHVTLPSPPPASPQWRFELSPGADLPRRSIDDLVLHLRYTAREGRAPQDPYVASRWTVIRLHVDAPTAWNSFVEGAADGIPFELTSDHFPRPPGSATTWELRRVKVATSTSTLAVALSRPGGPVPFDVPPTPPGAPPTVDPVGEHVGIRTATAPGLAFEDVFTVWTLSFTGDLATERSKIKEAWLLLEYGGVAP